MAPPFDLSDHLPPTYKEQYRKTGDPRYVALAIGQNPASPPEWALAACREIYTDYKIEVVRFDDPKGRARKTSKADGRLLFRVAELIRQGKSKTAALKEVTGEDVDGTNYKRLLRAWNADLRTATLRMPGAKEKKINRWLIAVMAKENEEYNQRAFDQAVKEIEAGDLEIKLPPDFQERQQERARWAYLGPVDDEFGMKVLVAPHPTFEEYVQLMKRQLLEPDEEELQDETTEDR